MASTQTHEPMLNESHRAFGSPGNHGTLKSRCITNLALGSNPEASPQAYQICNKTIPTWFQKCFVLGALKNLMGVDYPHSFFVHVFQSEMGVSKNEGTPKSSILIGFSIIFTVHFQVPLLLETPKPTKRIVSTALFVAGTSSKVREFRVKKG